MSFLKCFDLCKKIMLFCITAILVYYVFTLFQIHKLLMYIFHLVFPFFIALFIHFLLDPIINYFESDRLSRKIVVVFLYACFSLFGFLLIYSFAPYIADECIRFYKDYCNGQISVHPVLKSVFDFFNDNGITDYLMGILNGFTQSLFYWISNLALGVGISFYLSYDDIHVIEDIVTYIPFYYQSLYRKYLKKLKLVTYSFMKSLFLDFICFFFMALIPFFFIDSSYFVWIALFLAITNLIPYVGPFLGGIPIVIYEYMNNPESGYIAFLIVIILQYLESSYLQPYLFQKCIDVHPIALFFALSFFGDIFGIIGMIFSPLFLVYVLYIIDLIKEGKLIDKMKRIVHKI